MGYTDTEVDEKVNQSLEPMSEELTAHVKNYTPVERAFAMYRAKGLTLSEACQKAGSKTKDVTNRTKQGYLMQRKKGMKEYITYLSMKKTIIGVVTQDELVENARHVITKALEDGKYGDAAKAIELLGVLSGHIVSGSKKAAYGVNSKKLSELVGKPGKIDLGGDVKLGGDIDVPIDPGVAAFRAAEDEDSTKKEQLDKVKKIMNNLRVV